MSNDTITVTGTAGNSGTTLSVVVPALARTGNLTVLGSATSRTLQIVPVLRAVGGTVAAGNTIVLEGTGLSTNDLAITIDGRGVGSFSRRTVVDADSTMASHPGSSLAAREVEASGDFPSARAEFEAIMKRMRKGEDTP